MSVQEIVAYVGAAAWLPHIFKWIYNLITRPSLKIVPNQSVEIGYTSFGPIFNLKAVLISENKPLLIERMEIVITHADGDTHKMQWVGIAETFSEITDSQGYKQIVSKEQTAIALKLHQDYLNEKTIRFQEPIYHEVNSKLFNELNSHISYLKTSDPENAISIISKSHYRHNIIKHKEDSFWWKQGCYSAKINITSTNNFLFKNDTFTFTLDQSDVEVLRLNIPFLTIDFDNNLCTPEKIIKINWNWINPKIKNK